jgi:arylsulfatase A-like enzyme
MKWSLYEGGIREPLIIRWPGHIAADKTDSTTVLGSVDFFPTICALAGVAMPKDTAIDGIDASTAWLGAPMPRSKPLLWEYGRKADYLFPKENGARSPNLAIREGDWKLLVNADGSGVELYNLAADPNESTDLTVQKPERVARLKAAVLAWRTSLP